MSEIVIHGVPGSPYLRSALLGLEEKGLPYRLALMLAPQLEFFRATPEGAGLLNGTSFDTWLTRMSMRASMQATQAEWLRKIA